MCLILRRKIKYETRDLSMKMEVKMARFFYELSENGWEYTGNIEVEADEKPVCTNDNGEHYLIVNGAKIIFDEEIVEAK